MTKQEIDQLIDQAPLLKFTLNWMVADAVKRNDATKPGDYSNELLLAIAQRDLLKEIVK